MFTQNAPSFTAKQQVTIMLNGMLRKYFRTVYKARLIGDYYSSDPRVTDYYDYLRWTIIDYATENMFPSFMDIEHAWQHKKEFASYGCILETLVLLNAEEAYGGLVDFFIDKNITIKRFEIQAKEKFSAIHFSLLYQDVPVSIFQSMYSVESLEDVNEEISFITQAKVYA